MPLPSSGDNIRYNGTGRSYHGDVGGSSIAELGEMDGVNFNQAVQTTKVKSNRTAARGTLFENEDDREATLSFGLRELTAEHLKMVLLGTALTALSQAKGSLDGEVVTPVDDAFKDLGKLDCTIVKMLHGAVTGGPFQVAETITGGTSAATAKVAWTNGLLELIDVVGTFQAGEIITGGTSAATAAVTSVTTIKDMVVLNDSDATRYVLGTDYDLDADYGYFRKLSGGAIAGDVHISCNHAAITGQEFHGLSQATVTKKIVFVTDAGDRGPRKRYTFHKVQIKLDGDFPLMGDGESVLKVSATVLEDTTQASGNEYYKVEVY